MCKYYVLCMPHSVITTNTKTVISNNHSKTYACVYWSKVNLKIITYFEFMFIKPVTLWSKSFYVQLSSEDCITNMLRHRWRSHLCVRVCTCIPWFFKFPSNDIVCLYICTSWNCIHAPLKTLTLNFVDTLYFLGLKHWWCCYRWQSYLVAFTYWLCYFYLIFVICNVSTFF